MRSYRKQPRIIGKPYTRDEGADKVTRVNIYKKHPTRVSYIVVDLDGPKKGGITTYIPKATATHIKETGIDFS